MAVQRSLILETELGHRRGVVLGLTMAEVLLLLLFCILLATAAIMERIKSDTAEEIKAANQQIAHFENEQPTLVRLMGENQTLQEQVERASVQIQKLKEVLSDPADTTSEPLTITDAQWRELVLAREAIRTAKANGMTVSELVEAKTITPTKPPATPKTHDWPPIITLGNDQYRFPLGSAALSDDFKHRLHAKVPELKQLLNKYDVDVIEVVGHTDEQPIHNTQVSTLDDLAIKALHGGVPIDDLKPVDNAGLGLARAIAVAHELSTADFGPDVRIIPLSAAQLVLPGDHVSNGNQLQNSKSRRRIEIRVRRSNNTTH